MFQGMSGLLVVGQNEIVLPRPERAEVDARIAGILEALQVLPPPEHNPIHLSDLWDPWPCDFFLPLNWKVFKYSLQHFAKVTRCLQASESESDADCVGSSSGSSSTSVGSALCPLPAPEQHPNSANIAPPAEPPGVAPLASGDQLPILNPQDCFFPAMDLYPASHAEAGCNEAFQVPLFSLCN